MKILTREDPQQNDVLTIATMVVIFGHFFGDKKKKRDTLKVMSVYKLLY